MEVVACKGKKIFMTFKIQVFWVGWRDCRGSEIWHFVRRCDRVMVLGRFLGTVKRRE